MTDEENYYLLLDLDPDEDDRGRIKARIEERQRTWSRLASQGSPAKQAEASRSLKLIPDIKAKLLDDDDERKRMAASAKKALKARKQTELARLDSLIGVIKGSVVAPDIVKRLVNQVGGGVTEADVESRLKARGISVAAEGASARKRPARPRLETVVAKEIRRNLDLVGKKDLYDFLDMSRRSSCETLRDAGERLYKELSRKGSSPDVTTRNKLAGRCIELLGDEGKRERYDNTLGLEVMGQFDGHLEVAGRADKYLSRDEVEHVVGLALSQGIKRDAALEYIEDYARQKKFGVQPAGGSSSGASRVCGFCDTLAKADGERCRQCGEELVQPCPRCKNPTPTEDRCCGSCGFSTGDEQYVRGLLEEGRKHLAGGDFAGAAACFDRALECWKDWPPALNEKKKLDEGRKRFEAELRAVEALVAERKLRAAQTALGRFERTYGNSATDALRSRIESKLQAARAAHRRAEAHRGAGRDEEAFAGYVEAVDCCADFGEALQRLKQFPPAPPSALRVSMGAGAARLQWRAGTSRGGVAYRILRKKSGAPGGPEDGEVLSDGVAGTSWDDPKVPPGVPWHYAVFAVRRGVASATGAASGPHLLVKDPDDVRVEAADGQVVLRWTRPPGCAGVEVWRNRGSGGPRAQTGTRVTVSGESATDLGLENDATYDYVVVACFRDPVAKDGSVRRSPGVRVRATPVAAPAPVTDLSVSREGRNAFLEWTPPERGNVQIRQTRSVPGDALPGKLIRAQEADRYGESVRVTGVGAAQAALAGQGRSFFVPLTVVADTAALGSPVSVVNLDEVTDAKAQRVNDSVQVTWNWPPGADTVVVVFRSDNYPADAEDGKRHEVRRADPGAGGRWELPRAARVPYYFTIFVKDAREELYSTGVRARVESGIERRVTYEVRRPRWWRAGSGPWIDLQAERGVGTLVDLDVVLKPDGLPTGPKDGSVVASCGRLPFHEGRARIDLQADGQSGFVKVFFRNPGVAPEVRLVPGRRERLRLD